MSVTRIQDVVVPSEFTQYVVQNSVVSSALSQSGVLVPNGVISQQLQAGAESFTAPFWNDVPDDEADIQSDDPTATSTPHAITSGKQIVRKAALHNSWSSMNLASELSGDNPLTAIQGRVTEYWGRQTQLRLVASLKGIMAGNIANNAADMVIDVSKDTPDSTSAFSASAVIDAAATLGDALRNLTAIGMHSTIYKAALKNDLIQTTLRQSDGSFIQSFRGLQVVVDDGLPNDGLRFTTALFGHGAVGYGISAPRVAPGTEIQVKPDAGNGGGQTILHSRVNLAVHPAGFQWVEGSIAGQSPTIAELADASHWSRVFQRKAIPLAFLVTN